MSNYRELLERAKKLLIRPYSDKNEFKIAQILIFEIEEELAKPDPEPEAYHFYWKHSGQYFGCYQDNKDANDVFDTVPLYTSPLQQKPLNDDINRLIVLINRMNEDRKIKDYQSLHLELSEAISIANKIGK